MSNEARRFQAHREGEQFIAFRDEETQAVTARHEVQDLIMDRAASGLLDQSDAIELNSQLCSGAVSPIEVMGRLITQTGFTDGR